MRKTVLLLISLIFTSSIAPEVFSGEKKEHWLVIGGAENIGYNFAKFALDNKIPLTLFIPDKDRKKLDKLSERNLITLSEAKKVFYGDPLTDITHLKKAAQKATHIFFDVDFDFKHWGDSTLKVADRVIETAKKAKATLVHIGRIYAYGDTDIIYETSARYPNSFQGKIMAEVEQKIEHAATREEIQARIIRIPYPFGPALDDHLMSNTFIDTPTTGQVTWLYRSDIPLQVIYSYDIPRLARLYLEKNKRQSFDLINLPGYTIESIEHFGREIQSVSGKQPHYKTIGPWEIKFYTFLEYDATRGVDVRYSFEKTILLDDTRLKELVPEYQNTKIHKAIDETIHWYKRFS